MGYFKNLDIERQEQLLADTYYGADEPEMSPEELMLPDEDEIEAIPQPEQDIEPDFCWEAEEPEPEDIDESGYDSEYAPEIEHYENMMKEQNKQNKQNKQTKVVSDLNKKIEFMQEIIEMLDNECFVEILNRIRGIKCFYDRHRPNQYYERCGHGNPEEIKRFIPYLQALGYFVVEKYINTLEGNLEEDRWNCSYCIRIQWNTTEEKMSAYLKRLNPEDGNRLHLPKPL